MAANLSDEQVAEFKVRSPLSRRASCSFSTIDGSHPCVSFFLFGSPPPCKLALALRPCSSFHATHMGV